MKNKIVNELITAMKARVPEKQNLAGYLADIFSCGKEQAFTEMFNLLDQILERKSLKSYGADDEMLKRWTEEVITGQQRLMKNNFVFLDAERVLKIYRELY